MLAEQSSGQVYSLPQITFCQSGHYGEPLVTFIVYFSDRREFVCHAFGCLNIVGVVLAGLARPTMVF
jgi:hypothetical protein